MSPVTLTQVEDTLPEGFDILLEEASREGYRHMTRLAEEWIAGFRFNRPGECLMAAWSQGQLAAMAGVTHDPVIAGATRMRRFYVRPAFRRNGTGRALANALVRHASLSSQHIFVNSGTELAASFWEAVGFTRRHENGHTHVLAAAVAKEPTAPPV